jgi:hypothetical protein
MKEVNIFVEKGSHLCGLLHIINENEFDNKLEIMNYKNEKTFSHDLHVSKKTSEVTNRVTAIFKVCENIDNDLYDINYVLTRNEMISKDISNLGFVDRIGLNLIKREDFYIELGKMIKSNDDHQIDRIAASECNNDELLKTRKKINIKLSLSRERDICTTEVYMSLKKSYTQENDLISNLSKYIKKVIEYCGQNN